LIVRVKNSEGAAWERLATLFTPIVYEWARRANLQESDAADLVQEVFQAVAKDIDRFERGPNLPRFRAWLWGITRHKLLDQFRNRQSQPQAVGGSNAKWQLEQLPEEPPEDADDQSNFEVVGSLAHRALALIQTDFREQTWQAFWRVTIGGEAPSDVSAELGMKVGAVYTAKSRVLAHLRHELEGLD
jgi:RNA polymerase sigma-70 factor (ECF subfamily)